uniref:GM10731p n=1 Tax=Drosophila melanogaster TaxID=7227 RepID=Q95S32_DROME|nr:GM10731p [Drosophila melanogaster]
MRITAIAIESRHIHTNTSIIGLWPHGNKNGGREREQSPKPNGLPTASASSAASNTTATCQESKNNQMHSKYPTTKYTKFSITKQAKSD